MSTTNTWRSRTTVRASPAHVIHTLTDPDACARWSPIPFSLDSSDSARLRPGTTAHVSGRMLGAHVRFKLHALAADPGRLYLHAHGPIDILVDYTLAPVAPSTPSSPSTPHSRLGRLLARATGLLLATGALDHAVDRIAHEAELAADTSGSPTDAPKRAARRDPQQRQARPRHPTCSAATSSSHCGRVR